jgi:hypothetical protein
MLFELERSQPERRRQVRANSSDKPPIGSNTMISPFDNVCAIPT